MAKQPVKILSAEDALAKRYEVNELFTPSTPVSARELFAGRSEQLIRIIDTVAERGRHAIIYGERGVGKTSLVKMIPLIIPGRSDRVRYIRVQAFPTDNYHSICHNIFKRIRFKADAGDGEQEFDATQAYSGTITPDDFVNEMSNFRESDVPVIVVDEFNEIKDQQSAVLFAHTIKALSDAGANVTMIVVGVADNVSVLIENHQSIQRCSEEILMPRMEKTELLDVLLVRLRQLDFTISGDAKWKIINLAKGLPAFVHALGKHACLNSLNRGRRLHIDETDVDAGITDLIRSSDQTFKKAYHDATVSNQPGNLLKHALTACALAQPDEYGYFTPVAVREPLSAILQRPIEFANFQNHLKAFIDPKRGQILQRRGEPRAYRFRFVQPAMQPYVIMRGITEGILDEQAKRALSYPEQPDLFPSEI
jgi:Cdc6-like AAA superfamily ATPase